MNKQQILDALTVLAGTGEVSRAEVDKIFDFIPEQQESGFLSKTNLHGLLYYVGGGIVFIGICVLFGQNWESLGSLARILTTMGGFVAFYFAAVVFSRNPRLVQASDAFFVLAYLLLPLGLGVTLYENGVIEYTPAIGVTVSALCAVTALGSLVLFKRSQHLFFGFIFTTILEFSVITWIHSHFNIPINWKREAYIFLVVGLNYLVFGKYFLQNNRRSMAAFANFFGLLAVLISGLVLGSWKPEANIFWETAYPLLAFSAIFASLYLQSKLYLVFGLLALFAYILKITSEYFSNTLGWPLAIVLAGLLIMATGYAVFALKKKYEIGLSKIQ